MQVDQVHVDSIIAGDVIICRDGQMRTVTPEYIKENSFIGRTIFGDSYNIGTVKVQKVVNRRNSKVN